MRRVALVLLLLVGTVQAQPGLTVEEELPDGVSYSAHLVSYASDGLKVHAMVAVPKSARPEKGYPVLIANHGYVPDPRLYGVGADGVNSRPGDYYRSVPELYTSRGFLVVMPDYRGHNSSEGYEQIKDQDRENMQAVVNLYAADVISFLSLLGEIEDANTDQVFMWSHSMGGGVALRVLLAADVIKAATFWSTMNLDDLEEKAESLSAPVLFHHSKGDQSTDYLNSVSAADAMVDAGRQASLRIYDSQEHYFSEQLQQQAADTDRAFFLSAD